MAISFTSRDCIAWSASISPKTIAITDKGLAALRGLDFLAELNLDRLDRYREHLFGRNSVPLTDACLVHLQALPRLEVLTLSGNLITDEGLARIARMTNLEDTRSRGDRDHRRRSAPPRRDEEPRDRSTWARPA